MNNLNEEIIAKFLMGTCTEDELIQVNTWINASEENARTLFRLEEIYQLGRENYVSDQESRIDKAEKKLYKILSEETAKQQSIEDTYLDEICRCHRCHPIRGHWHRILDSQ